MNYQFLPCVLVALLELFKIVKLFFCAKRRRQSFRPVYVINLYFKKLCLDCGEQLPEPLSDFESHPLILPLSAAEPRFMLYSTASKTGTPRSAEYPPETIFLSVTAMYISFAKA